jgi:hypothetical protein
MSAVPPTGVPSACSPFAPARRAGIVRTRGIALLASVALLACAPGHEPPATQPAPPPAPRRPPVTGFTPRFRLLRACVVQNGELAEVQFDYDVLTGDSVYQGVPFSQAFPAGPGYAEAADWYATNEPVRYGGQLYVKYGDPRVLEIEEIARVGENDGVGIYVAVGDVDPDVIYLPVRPGCVFQPYAINTK